MFTFINQNNCESQNSLYFPFNNKCNFLFRKIYNFKDSIINDMIDEENIQLFKALSEETRYRIIKALIESENKCRENKYGNTGELCACEIPEIIGRTQSNTSMHLAKLQNWGIIKVRKEGKMRLYSIENNKIRKVLKVIDE
ncbi:transcriptional regulator [Methanosarcina barkeri 3]|uniref:Transcriptional regulator n=2 Tax=Methanosarcina barkeri TaxID=2208 RepID=A0A0E3SJB6_METBA|nr:transcriptional regulator [Methanosarcina barkeri 3]